MSSPPVARPPMGPPSNGQSPPAGPPVSSPPSASLVLPIDFADAERKDLKLRMSLDGPAGSGKTYTALRLGFGMKGFGAGTSIGVINTEGQAVLKYKGLAPDGIPWQFKICTLTEFSPSAYTAAIKKAESIGIDILIIDSLSHAWAGKGGALDLVDRQSTGNSFTAWKTVTPIHNDMFEAIANSTAHIIATMRSKPEYVLEEDARGKKVPKRVGMAPIQRAGVEYEFDVYGSLDLTHSLSIEKTRCPALDGLVVVKPGADFVEPLVRWLSDDSNNGGSK